MSRSQLAVGQTTTVNSRNNLGYWMDLLFQAAENRKVAETKAYIDTLLRINLNVKALMEQPAVKYYFMAALPFLYDMSITGEVNKLHDNLKSYYERIKADLQQFFINYRSSGTGGRFAVTSRCLYKSCVAKLVSTRSITKRRKHAKVALFHHLTAPVFVITKCQDRYLWAE